jgi:hypothetical protein
VDADEQLEADLDQGQGQQQLHQHGLGSRAQPRHTGQTPTQGVHTRGAATGAFQQREAAGHTAPQDMHRTPLLGMGGHPRAAPHHGPSNVGGRQGMPMQGQQHHSTLQPALGSQPPHIVQPRSIPSIPSLLAGARAQRLGDLATLRPALVPALKPHIAQQSLGRLGTLQGDPAPRLLQAGQSLSAGHRTAGAPQQGGPVVPLGRLLPPATKAAVASRRNTRRKDALLLDVSVVEWCLHKSALMHCCMQEC